MTSKKITLWEKVKTKYAPKAANFITKWNDVVLILPAALLLFIFNERWIRLIDQTAASMSLEFLGILNWNIFLAVVINVFAYIIYNTYHGDFFNKKWEETVGLKFAAVIHICLWLSTLALTAFLLLRGL